MDEDITAIFNTYDPDDCEYISMSEKLSEMWLNFSMENNFLDSIFMPLLQFMYENFASEFHDTSEYEFKYNGHPDTFVYSLYVDNINRYDFALTRYGLMLLGEISMKIYVMDYNNFTFAL
ncbi:hypothetical protein [Drosophila suzukii associated hytrosavirus 1]|nr:hypothetical protein [Drosophila suzukii associated hytrosavirus 1]